MPSTKLLGASSRLARAVQLNGTCSMRYQKAALRAYATFLSGNALLLSSSNVTVDVTALVAFESSDVVVATVGTSSINDAAVLEGHAPGVTEVSVVLSAVGHPSVSMNDATVAVQVSQDVPAMVEELTVVDQLRRERGVAGRGRRERDAEARTVGGRPHGIGGSLCQL